MKPEDFHSSKAGQAIRAWNGCWTFIPAPLPPDLDRMSTLIGAFSDAVRELARLTTLAGNFPFQLLMIQPSIRCEVVSNSIPCMAAKSCADRLLDSGVLRGLQDMRAARSLGLMRSSRHWRILNRLLREIRNRWISHHRHTQTKMPLGVGMLVHFSMVNSLFGGYIPRRPEFIPVCQIRTPPDGSDRGCEDVEHNLLATD
jgi:hypothetical protein